MTSFPNLVLIARKGPNRETSDRRPAHLGQIPVGVDGEQTRGGGDPGAAAIARLTRGARPGIVWLMLTRRSPSAAARRIAAAISLGCGKPAGFRSG